MARIAAEARVEERAWSLVFKHAGWHQMLRAGGYYAGHDTKDRLVAWIEEELLTLNAEVNENGERHVANLGNNLIGKRHPDSASKTGVKRRSKPPAHPSPAHRRRRENNDGSEESNISKIVIAREFEACAVSSGAAESILSEERTPKQLQPALSPEVVAAATATDGGQPCGEVSMDDVESRQRRWDKLSARPNADGDTYSLFHHTTTPAAALDDSEFDKQAVGGSLQDTAPVHMDEGLESSLDLPVIQSEVDNFVIHANSRLASITTLPVYIDGALAGGAIPPEQVFLVGTVGPDCDMFKEKVEMWRLVLDPSRRPRFLLKTNKSAWVRLLNPQEDYRKIMREVHVLGHFLNFVKKLPNATQAAAEQDLQNMCRCHFCSHCGFSLSIFWQLRRTHDIIPTLDRLSRHIKVIRSYVEYDDEFAKSPLLRKIFPSLFSKLSSSETPGRDESNDSEYEQDIAGAKRKAGRLPLMSESTEKKKRYKVMAKKNGQRPSSFRATTPELHCHSDDDVTVDRSPQNVKDKRRASLEQNDFSPVEEDSTSKDAHRRIFTKAESDVEDPPICVLCDDGGSLLYCDGPCHRHFHACEGQGSDSFCETLGLSATIIKAMGKFYCLNCEHNQQQCFICGELGSSVGTTGPQEVRCCDISVCQRFFHVDCVTRTVCASSTRDWRDLSAAINDGSEKFYCPRHCCSVCGEAEMEEPGLLVQCRRCPKAWHRECLVDFSRSKELESTVIWNHYGRQFIYCRNHKIVPKLQTPARTHLIFPTVV